MKTYAISKDYELFSNLLECGNTVIYRYGNNSWKEISRNIENVSPGHYRSQMFRRRFRLQNWEFIIPNVNISESHSKNISSDRLPEWAKTDKWIYKTTEKYFAKIIEVSADNKSFSARRPGENCIIGSGDLNYNFNWKPARVRPWTFEEAPSTLKIKSNVNGNLYVAQLCHAGAYKIEQENGVEFVSFEKIAQIATQINDSPCGILEVEE